MLKPTSKAYCISKYGGDYEDSWTEVVGICSSFQLAQELKAQIEESLNSECSITEEEYFDMCTNLSQESEDNKEFEELSELEGLIKLYPQYTKEEIEKAYEKYEESYDSIIVEIKEIDFYN